MPDSLYDEFKMRLPQGDVKELKRLIQTPGFHCNANDFVLNAVAHAIRAISDHQKMDKVVELLLKEGFAPDRTVQPWRPGDHTRGYLSTIGLAVRSASVETIRRLLEAGASAGFEWSWQGWAWKAIGGYPYHAAYELGRDDVCALLQEFHANHDPTPLNRLMRACRLLQASEAIQLIGEGISPFAYSTDEHLESPGGHITLRCATFFREPEKLNVEEYEKAIAILTAIAASLEPMDLQSKNDGPYNGPYFQRCFGALTGVALMLGEAQPVNAIMEQLALGPSRDVNKMAQYGFQGADHTSSREDDSSGPEPFFPSRPIGNTGAMIHIQSLIDDAKCFETVRTLRCSRGCLLSPL